MATITPQRKKAATWAAVLCITALAFVGSFLHKRPEKGGIDFDVDPHFELPKPPTSLPYSRTYNIVVISFMTATGLLAVLLGARDARRTRTILPVVLPLSGAMIAFPETFIDVMGGIYYPWSDKNASFHILGREMLPWITIWFGYGALMQTTLQLLYNKATTRTLWLFLGFMMVSDLIVEEIMLPMGVYHYYGNQPLIVLNMFPWWYMAPNSVGVFLATALAFRFRHHLVGYRSLAVLLLTPMSVGGIYGFIAFPAWVAINGDFGWFLTDVLGLLTLIFGGLAFAGILELVLVRNPFDMDGKGEQESLSESITDADVFRDEP
ncbi:hypothetical protein OPT61_g1201 [Boeremia exigua]|uniref:Uncharacterized protein n=1 Tax=Boeremia exigua TaxID=749465 RepID=A0ACC2IRD8_9PLEO|nr:hypothetical protein OPT61_g1201 [Boeremia exigua]